jgi:SAM-dependent methyltransferase
MQSLKDEVKHLRKSGVTEEGLDKLVRTICGQVKAAEVSPVSCHAFRELLLAKLESGDYTPDGINCKDAEWQRTVEDAINGRTITAYNTKLGILYEREYGDKPLTRLVTNLVDLLGSRKHGRKRALDVGCGPGQYAKLLKQHGFRVELLDASTQMLRLAAKKLRLKKRPKPFNWYSLIKNTGENIYDVIFASAMMVHVPREKAPDLYSAFYRLLREGGILFVNFKVGDHTLISLEGRFYVYYRDESLIQKQLEDAGFTVIDSLTSTNRQNLYGRPKTIRWVNFYCRKPE